MSTYIQDACGSGAATVRDKSPPNAPIQSEEDEWHYKKLARKYYKQHFLKGASKAMKDITFKEIWTHLRYAHSQGFGDPLKVQQIVFNAIQHYKGIHTNCCSDTCQDPTHSSSHRIESESDQKILADCFCVKL